MFNFVRKSVNWTVLFRIVIFQSEDIINLGILIGLFGISVWSFVLIFIYCELGQRVNEAFNRPYDAICQHESYLYSIEIQRMLPVIILIAQQPIDLRGYGNFSCTRDRFKSVSGNGYLFDSIVIKSTISWDQTKLTSRWSTAASHILWCFVQDKRS